MRTETDKPLVAITVQEPRIAQRERSTTTHSLAHLLCTDMSVTSRSMRTPEYMKKISEKMYAMSVAELSCFSWCGEKNTRPTPPPIIRNEPETSRRRNSSANKMEATAAFAITCELTDVQHIL